MRWRSPIVPGQYFHYIWCTVSLLYPCHASRILVSPLTGPIASRRTVGVGVRVTVHRRLMTIYHMVSGILDAGVLSSPQDLKLQVPARQGVSTNQQRVTSSTRSSSIFGRCCRQLLAM
ncbi:hypothetical protein BKA58DRAFT_372058 [Alternaria rosae]|uniref:uncharacterized protein n=1 Tax=Alternaria rosae TaxID=1187941 RepID=UPI001E8EC260|nr:uncharacterized protein BKA58DRAFT_372058 [Alternaria rosae]KAH6881718.1 hypothetical protein BKA58DRAFT_372058 [Alternaria rosae]